MDIEWHSEAEAEFLQLPERVQRKVKQHIEKLPEEGLDWNKVGFVGREDIGLEAYRIKVASEDDEGLNHRVIFDVEGQVYLIYKVGRRLGFYDEENLREVEGRI